MCYKKIIVHLTLSSYNELLCIIELSNPIKLYPSKMYPIITMHISTTKKKQPLKNYP